EDDPRIAEHVFLRGLQRLHEHEVDREQAVDRHERDEAAASDRPHPRARRHTAFGASVTKRRSVALASVSTGSNSRKSSRSTTSRNGTSISDSADAGPN